MPWAGLLRRSDGRMRSVAGVQAYRFGQPLLTFVEGPKFFGVQFKSAGYVQGIESANAEGGTIAAGEVNCSGPGLARHSGKEPDTTSTMMLKAAPCSAGLRKRDLRAEYLMSESMRDFRLVQLRYVNRRSSCDAAARIRRIDLIGVERNQKTAIRVNGQ